MKSEPRRILRTLIVKHGLDLCSDVKRCQGLLRDLCGAYPREVNILIGALRERVPLDLLAGQKAMPHGLLIARLTRRLEDQLGLTEEAALWGVESWALALGIATEVELEEARKRSATATQPAATPQAPEEKLPRESISIPAPARTAPAPARAPKTTTHQPAPGALPTAATPRTTAPSPAQPLEPPVNYGSQRRSGFKLRGCAMGCVLIILLSSLLFLVVPYVISVLREEQQQINEPRRVPQQ